MSAPPRGKILIVEDDEGLLATLLRLLRKVGYSVQGVRTAEEGLEILEKDPPDVVITDMVLPGKSGLELLSEIKGRWPETEVVLMTGYGTVRSAVEAMKMGAFDYLTKPFERNELLTVLDKIFSMRSLMDRVEELEALLKGGKLVGKSKRFIEVVERAKAIAQTDIPVLIMGESGTGKEVLARFIHEISDRKDGPFVPVNCSAIPRDLFESELFGHRRGAFTGAVRDSLGLFRSADRGTLFLDEIAEMPLELQPKLLRAIETRHIRPVGATEEVEVNARIIAATNQDIRKAVEEGRFRQDLYYRFVVILELPPLRERKEDIPLLVNHFIEKFNKIYKRNVRRVEPRAMDALVNYEWPGNVRELENVLEGIFAFGVSEVITFRDLPPFLRTFHPPEDQMKGSLREMEKELILRTLEQTGWNKVRAAKILKISRATLYRKLKEYGLA